MSFGTAVNCMDGRVQLPITHYLKDHYAVRYVDMVTEDGPVRSLADPDSPTAVSILRRVALSVEEHGSRVVAVVAHADCAGNPVDEATQRDELAASAATLRTRFPDAEVVQLWVDADWTVVPVPRAP